MVDIKGFLKIIIMQDAAYNFGLTCTQKSKNQEKKIKLIDIIMKKKNYQYIWNFFSNLSIEKNFDFLILFSCKSKKTK